MGFITSSIISAIFACPSLQSKRFSRCIPLGDTIHYEYPSFKLETDSQKTQIDRWSQELKMRLKDGHRALSYDCLWKALSETDSDPMDTLQVQLFYKRNYVDVANRDCGQNDGDSWNREHIWAKSRGFPKKSSWAYRDLHHIRPSDRSLNTWRSNRFFEEFSEDEELLNRQNEECIQGCFKDKEYFEPPAEVKGEVARSILYMVFRYDGQEGDRTPDLVIYDKFPHSKTKEGEWGGLCTLLKWHDEDPPNDLEIYRNNMVQIWQGNRNPFVDHPEWVQVIFGTRCP